MQDDEPQWNIWLTFFLTALAKQVRHLKKKVANEHLLRSMPELSMRIIELIQQHGPISIAQAESLLKVNKYTLRDHFKHLVEDGHLIQLGKGRATKYHLAVMNGDLV